MSRQSPREIKSTSLPRDLVPVLARLSSFAPEHGEERELEAFLRDHLESYADIVLPSLHAGRGILCLDGLDEIGDPGVRLRAMRAIEAWTALHPGRCWVTTRIHGALKFAECFSPFDLEPFGWHELREYLVRREQLRVGDWEAAATRADAWLQRVGAGPRLLDLLRIPLLLVLALAVSDRGQLLPAERVTLYEAVIETLVDAWNRERRGKAALRRPNGEVVDARAICDALARVALRRHEHCLLAVPIHHRELHRLLADELGDPGRADGALEVLVDQAGLLLRAGDERHFWHASFGEYLAATALARTSRDRPQRLLRTAGSPEGRELVRMAISWARVVDHDPALAGSLFEALLSEQSGGSWVRFFGVPVRLAVDCVRDGHPLDDAGFARLLARVLDLVERAPLGVNTDLLTALVAARPMFDCPPVERLVGLLRRPSLVADEVSAALMRWIAPLAPQSPDAHACCQEMLTQREGQSRTWAALGLLRAGDVRPELCIEVGTLAWRSRLANRLENEIHSVLAPSRVTLLPALRALWAGSPTTAHRNGLRFAIVALLALLDDDREDVLAALIAAISVKELTHSFELSSAPLRWLANRSDAARHRLGEALFDPDAAVRAAAVQTLRLMFQRPDQADAAVAAVLVALQRDPQPLSTATDVLAASEAYFDPQRERTVLDALRELVARDRDLAPVALARGWSALPASASYPRWLLAALLWREARRSVGAVVGELAECLLTGTTSDDAAVAVTSACLLNEAWEHLAVDERRTLLIAWRSGLRHSGALAVDTPVGPVCSAAWQALSGRLEAGDPDARTELLPALASEHPIEATIAATLLLSDPELARRCRAVLEDSLRADDPQQALVALQALEQQRTVLEPGLHDAASVAMIRLILAGWTERRYKPVKATLALIALYLSTVCTVTCYPADLTVGWLDTWLAGHPDALDLAVGALVSGPPGRRAVALLAACLDTPEQVERLVAGAAAADPAQVDGAVAALRRACIRVGISDPETPLRGALKRGLLTLLRPRLPGDLAATREAVGLLDYFYIRCNELPTARGRLLDADDPPWRRQAIRDWLIRKCPPEQREAWARQWFDRDLPRAARLSSRRIDGGGRADRPAHSIPRDQLREHNAMTAALLSALAKRWPAWLCTGWHDGTVETIDFSTFVAGPEVPDPMSRVRWRSDLDASDPEARDHAVLALALCEPVDDALADALIDTHFAWRPLAAQRALDLLRRPECTAVFGARRRARAQAWRGTPEDAAEVLMLWSPEELYADRDVALPLLRAAASRDDAWAGYRAAILMDLLDPPAAVEAMRALASHSTEAGAWLIARGHACSQAETRLWWALENPDEYAHWELAAATLLPTMRDDPRLVLALERIAVTGNLLASGHAIWLLAGLSREHALVVSLERLASERQHREAVSWLAALAGGHQPGRRPFEVAPPSPDEPVEQARLDLFESQWAPLTYDRPLDGLAEALVTLAPQIDLDLDGATATRLGGDAARWSALWQRATNDDLSAAELDELRAVVDLRHEDRPGQQFARLYWRVRLSEPRLLQRDRAVFVALTHPSTTHRLLMVEFLRDKFNDDAKLRAFMADLGLRDDLPLSSTSLTLIELRHAACEVLTRHGKLPDAIAALERRGLLNADERRAWDRAPRDA